MRPSNPIINVRRPTLSLRTRVACALVRARTYSDVADRVATSPAGHRIWLTGACVAEASRLHGPTSVVCLHSSRAYDGLARAPTCSCVALTVRLSKRCLSKTARRVDFFVGVLW